MARILVLEARGHNPRRSDEIPPLSCFFESSHPLSGSVAQLSHNYLTGSNACIDDLIVWIMS